MARLSIVQQQMKEMLDHHSHLKDINLDDIALPKEQDKTTNTVDIMPKTPPYFRIASLKSVNSGTINFAIKSSLVPSCVRGDGSRVNLKVSRLLQELFGIKSPFTRCSSHMSYGTIRRLCTSETMSQIGVKGLYENLNRCKRVLEAAKLAYANKTKESITS